MSQKTKIKGLYTIIDTSYVSLEDIYAITEEIVSGGAKILQLRAKGLGSGDMLGAAKTIREITKRAGVLFLVNDRIDVALLSEADGVHIGDEDVPPKEARELLGEEAIIGYSTHNTAEIETAMGFAGGGLIDYVSCGPVFPTRTKKDARNVVGIANLRLAVAASRLPIVAIGGITEKNIAEVIEAGADSVAVISELLQAGDVSKKTKFLINSVEAANCPK